MKFLKLTLAIILISCASIFASTKGKMVKSELINGKIVPVVILKQVEVSAIKKEVELNGSAIADETFGNPKCNFVKSIFVKGKLMPFVQMKTAEIFATRNTVATNDDAINIASIANINSHLLKTTEFNGELMPSVELRTIEIVVARTDQSVLSKLSKKALSLIASLFDTLSMQ